jgi:CubicO group peptidase (beta-lactamase class C family)
MDGTRDSRLERLLSDEVGATYTAGVCLVASRGVLMHHGAVGNTDPEADGTAVTPRTPFDLASLTKLFTGAAALRLAANGDLTMDAPVHRILPSFSGNGKRAVTVRHLLTHTSGLPPGPALYGPNAPADPTQALLAVPLSAPAGERVIYSDTGFMVLGRVIEMASGLSLGAAVEELVCAPIGAHSAGYGPRPDAAATEWDADRGRRTRGRVHDENAAALGGVAGHAGLFGTAPDVFALCRAFEEGGCSFLPENLLAAATSEQAAEGAERRGLAWKLRSPVPDAPDHVFSPPAFGHYGFTGTSVWHDPRRDVTVVLLTNRVYYGREQDRIRRLRASLFRILAGAVAPMDGGDEEAR